MRRSFRFLCTLSIYRSISKKSAAAESATPIKCVKWSATKVLHSMHISSTRLHGHHRHTIPTYFYSIIRTDERDIAAISYSRRIRNHRFSVHHPSSFCLINTNHSSIWWKNYIRLSGLYVLCRESQRTATKTTTTTSADGIEEEKKCIFLLLPFLLTHPEHPNRAGFLLQFHIQIGVTVQRQHFSALLLI